MGAKECLEDNKLKFPYHKAGAFSVGERVYSKHNLSDYNGETFDMGESGEIVKVTRCTIHVRDPRGHVHSRPGYPFAKPEDFVKFGVDPDV